MKKTTLALMLLFSPLQAGARAASIHVSPNGNDANPGTRAKPFATLERARDEMQKLKQAGLREGGSPRRGRGCALQWVVCAAQRREQRL